MPGEVIPITLYGVDISNVNDGSTNRMNLAEIVAEGFSFIEAKVSQGSDFQDADWPRTRDFCQSNGITLVGYHYLDQTNPVTQASNCLNWLGDKSIPLMLDVENGGGNYANLVAVLNAIESQGGHVALTYLPQWYWSQEGKPNIAQLPGLVSSAYPGGTGTAAGIYTTHGGDSGSGWNGYGGGTPVIWQFTDQAQVAGTYLDADAYRGTLTQLRQLLGYQTGTGPLMALTDQRS